MGLPVWSTAGGTDSKVVDEQAAIESAISILFAALSGGDLTHDVGFIEGSSMNGSLQMAVMSDVVMSFVKRLLRGIEVDPETLASKVIHEVGPGGHFLSTDRTLNCFKREFWFPRLLDSSRREEWQAGGARSMEKRGQVYMEDILKNHRPASLTARAQEQIEVILANDESRYAPQTQAKGRRPSASLRSKGVSNERCSAAAT